MQCFFDLQRFLNYSKNCANISLKSTPFWVQICPLGARKLIVKLFWDVFGRCWKLMFFWCCFWVAKNRKNRGLGRPRAQKTARVVPRENGLLAGRAIWDPLIYLYIGTCIYLYTYIPVYLYTYLPIYLYYLYTYGPIYLLLLTGNCQQPPTHAVAQSAVADIIYNI